MTSSEKSKSATWKAVCLSGLVASVVGIGGMVFYEPPFYSDYLSDMWVLALFNLAFYFGPIAAIIGGMGWWLRR
ncbi:MAG: hypothetical protein JSS27_01570 [Planctomycetes bacterium]|nr:hypothetical protein [Planctomycetota bacterium]